MSKSDNKLLIDNIHFVGIGFRRCATSWLNHMLFRHPDICKPISGIHYFNYNYYKGEKWYFKNIMKDCNNLSKKMKYGEFSTTYSYPENAFMVVKRLKKDFPNVKILVNIRNPITRAQSDYLRSVRRNEIKKVGLRKACIINPTFIERGFYASIIQVFQEAFGRGNVHVTRYDDIINNPTKALETVYSFIGVNKIYNPEGVDERMGSTYNPRIVAFEFFVQKLQKMGRKINNQSRLKPLKIKSRKIVGLLRRANEDINQIDPDYEEDLLEVYRADIEKTQSITGLDLSKWFQKGSNEGI